MPSFNFAGFPGIGRPRYTQIPDIFFDVLAPNLSEAELRVLIYVMRRTFGFGKDSDTISIKQMAEGITTREGRVIDYGAGMSRQGVIKGVRGLVEKNVLIAHRNTDAAGGDLPTAYSLRFESNDVDTPESTRLTPPSQRGYGGGVNVIDPQETVEQETVKQETGLESSTSKDGPSGFFNGIVRQITYEFHDQEHLTSNQTRAHRLLLSSRLEEDVFIDEVLYPARDRAKRQAGIRQRGQSMVKNRMPYFFAIVEDLLKGGE